MRVRQVAGGHTAKPRDPRYVNVDVQIQDAQRQLHVSRLHLHANQAHNLPNLMPHIQQFVHRVTHLL